MTSLSADASRVDEALARARDLPIDQAELRATVEHLAGLGSSPLGFRNTGTPEDRAAAEYAAEQFRAIGLEDVAIEEVRVDGWRFEGAWLEAGEHRFEASSMGGVRAQVINRMEDLKDDLRLTYVFVAHDLSVVRQVSDRIAVT